MLAFPDFTQPFTLDSDASQSGIGAVISAKKDLLHVQVVPSPRLKDDTV